jgi:hypothetical protein
MKKKLPMLSQLNRRLKNKQLVAMFFTAANIICGNAKSSVSRANGSSAAESVTIRLQTMKLTDSRLKRSGVIDVVLLDLFKSIAHHVGSSLLVIIVKNVAF